jgi:uncharacterized protein YkwD
LVSRPATVPVDLRLFCCPAARCFPRFLNQKDRSMILRLTFCLVALLLGTVSARGQSPQPADPPKGQARSSATLLEYNEKEVDGVKLLPIEANIVSYTNDERARYGLPPLQVDAELMATAREQASWMTRSGRLMHTMGAVAENIAMGQPDSRDAVQAWMNSAGHRANILNAAHRLIGAAAFRTEGGTIFWCQQFRP